MATLQIVLPFKLDNYNDIKRFIDVIEQIIPEKVTGVKTSPHVPVSNYQFALQGVVMNEAHDGVSDFLNAIFRNPNVAIANMIITSVGQGISLGYLNSSTIMLTGNDIAKLEEFEARITELLRGNEGLKNQQQKQNPEDCFLKKNFGDLEFSSSVFDQKFLAIINERIAEIRKAMEDELPLAATILLGSALEGVLYMVATKFPQKFNVAKAAPKSKDGKVLSLGSWSLNNLIEVAYEVDVLDKDVRDFSKVLRDFRNYIHPNEQMRQNFSPTMATAGIAYQVLKAAMKQITSFVEQKSVSCS